MGWMGVKKALPGNGMRLWPSKKSTSKKRVEEQHGSKSRGFFGTSSGSGAGTPSPLEADLNKLFDSLRDPKDSPDSMALDSTSSYLQDQLGINPETAELLVAMEAVQAPAVGEINRKGFVEGWKTAGVAPNTKAQAKYVRSRIDQLSTDPALFKKVYRYTFVAAKEPDQKAISLEYAFIYWDTLFSPPGMQWKSENHDWLDLWKTYLTQMWTRSVNRDMWNMTLEFAFKSMEDETLSFWSEDGAWPSVIDDFVVWCRDSGRVAKPEKMETDA